MKKFPFFIAAIISVIVIAGVSSCKSSSKTSTARLLKFNLEKGKGYDYEMVWDMNQEMMGQESRISISSLYSINVMQDDGHIRSLTGTYRSFKMYMKMMGMEMDVDTDKPSPAGEITEEDIKKNPMGMMNRAFSGIVGKVFTMKVDEEGKVLEVRGFLEMLESMLDSVKIDEDAKSQAKASFKDQFNEQSIKDQFAQFFYIFPNKEVKVGDTWEKSYTTGGKMSVKFTTTYTAKEIEGDHVTLTSKTTIDSNGEMDIEGSQTGNILVDSKTGLAINAEFSQEINSKVEGITLKITGKGKIKGKAN